MPGALADAYDCFLLDLDGVLFRADEAIAGASETVARLREMGKRPAFLTNNSSKTPSEVGEKLRGLGMEVSVDEVVSSALSTASLLADRGARRAFVIGESGIREALREAGVEVVEGEADRVDVVVVGWDRSADYPKLRTAALLVQRGADLVATNGDPSYPAPDGLWPGAGALLAAVVTTTGARPEVVGKPNRPLFELARERAGGGRPLAVGDRLDTDIAGAAAIGWDSLLVFTGVARPADLMHARALPTFVGADVTALFQPEVGVREARESDVPGIEKLLAAGGLATDGCAERVAETFVAVNDDQLAGTVSLELFGPIGHLRSLAVEKEFRGSRIGTLLVARAVRLAGARGVRELYAVTESAQRFFEGLGFQAIGPWRRLPDPVQTPMVREYCSDGAVALRLAVEPVTTE